jgi:hypothetical protein
MMKKDTPGRAPRMSAVAVSAATAETMTPSGVQETAAATCTGISAGEDKADAARQEALGRVGQPWVAALRSLMGAVASTPDTPAFVWDEYQEGSSAAEVKALAETLRRDVIFLGFRAPFAEGPTRIIVARLGRKGTTVFEDCELWVLNHWTKVEIMTAARRFKLDDAGRLTDRSNTLDEMRARRVSLTHRRWAALAAEMATQAPFT